MIGISIYLSDIDEAYIKEAARLGARYVFTSLHIPEEDLSDLDNALPRLLQLMKETGMMLIPDISPYTFEKLGLANGDFQGLKAMGFELVRLDFGFEDVQTVLEIAKHFKLVLNASLVDEAYINDLLDVNFDLNDMILMHNFYPRQDSGLDEAYFEVMNQVHRQYNLKAMAFVAGDVKRRLPLYEGLPTLEKHRDLNAYVAAVELNRSHDIDIVLIGDNKTKISNLRFMADFFKERIVTIPAYFQPEHEALYDQIIKVRQDRAPSIIRLAIARKPDIQAITNNHRKKGAIVMDNHIAGRYSGEVQIIKEDLPYSARSNNIGWVHPDYVDLLKYIDYEVTVRFVRIQEASL